jgi:hypothetical protein
LDDDRSVRAFALLRERLAATRLDAMLEVASTRVDPDQVFVLPQHALVLTASDAWDAEAMRRALSAAAAGLWTNAGLGDGWRTAANNAQELNGLGKLVMAADGRRLMLSDSSDLIAAIQARSAQPAAAGAVYAAGWRHAQELTSFERMTRLIDFPQIRIVPPGPGGDQPAAREPMFYSENIASLGRALARVQSVTISTHDTGPLVREDVVYRLTP